MEITLTTPALLFSAISLLLLAYTNRFLAIANLIRLLYDKYREDPRERIMGQIQNLRLRVRLIKNMQFLGVGSLLLCVVSMFFLYIGFTLFGVWAFAVALVMLIVSLGISMWEIHMSVVALNLHLGGIEEIRKNLYAGRGPEL
jgi:cobalamin biosynthesis protein CobD/CbiB